MAGFFKKNKGNQRPRTTNDNRPVLARPKTTDKDLVDPIAYIGDLDSQKYPFLAQEKKEEELEVENPLNKR